MDNYSYNNKIEEFNLVNSQRKSFIGGREAYNDLVQREIDLLKELIETGNKLYDVELTKIGATRMISSPLSPRFRCFELSGLLFDTYDLLGGLSMNVKSIVDKGSRKYLKGMEKDFHIIPDTKVKFMGTPHEVVSKISIFSKSPLEIILGFSNPDLVVDDNSLSLYGGEVTRLLTYQRD